MELTDNQKLALMRRRRKRLLTLADFLEKKVQPILNGAKFKMTSWGHTTKRIDDEGNKVPPTEVKTLDDAKGCGYVACAVGWGLVCPQLRRHIIAARNDDWSQYANSIDDNKLAEVFGITSKEANELFMPHSYGTARSGYPINASIKTVVKRLRKYAEREPALPDQSNDYTSY